MSFRFQLHAGDAGDYEWGSLAARFPPATKVHKRTLVETLAGFASTVGPWKTEPEFRQMIAFMHECVHYLQDVLTGIGHWDYLIHRKHLSELITSARDLSWIPDSQVPYAESAYSDQDIAAPFYSRIKEARQARLDDLIFVPTSKLPAKRRNELITALSSTPHVKIPQSVPEDDYLSPFFVESLLESDATATVWDQYLTFEKVASADSEEIACQNYSLFHPGHMPIQYSSSLAFFYNALEIDPKHVKNPDVTSAHLVHAVMKMFKIFADLACAHPSPRLLNKVGASRIDYEPGVKFIRLVKAFRLLTTDEDQTFVEANSRGDTGTQESLLLGHCEYSYLRSKEVYEDWAQLFEEMIQESSNEANAVLRIRRQCCELRLTEPAACVAKNMWTIVNHTIPLFVLTPPGFTFHGFNFDHLDPDKQHRLISDLSFGNSDSALADYYLESGQFVCPLAEAKLCKAAKPVCLSGITESLQFPPAHECEMRKMLDEWGFDLSR